MSSAAGRLAPRGVIFDMDGLLIDTIPLYLTALEAASQEVGHPIAPAYLLSLVGLLGHELRDRLVQDFGPAFPVDALLRAGAARLSGLLGQGAPLKAGAAELVQHLSAAGIPIAVATSLTRAEAEHHLNQARLLGLFRAVVGRDDVPRSKPHPDPYLRAAALLALPPQQCLALEDSYNGIRSAHSAGCVVVMVPDVLQPTDEIRALCAGVARDLHAVRGMFNWEG
jgi:HAD superfamily hydrolase (TIGR01509 family)